MFIQTYLYYSNCMKVQPVNIVIHYNILYCHFAEKYECNYLLDPWNNPLHPVVNMVDKMNIIYFMNLNIVYKWNLNEENSKATVLTSFGLLPIYALYIFYYCSTCLQQYQELSKLLNIQ